MEIYIQISTYLVLIYVVTCGIRSIWPRKNGDRICFYDHWISIVFIGRTFATYAELACCAQLCLALISMTGETDLANILFVSNIIAQSCCWYSIISRDQRGHTIEEIIWMLTGLPLTYTCYNVDKKKLSKNAIKFSKLAVVFGCRNAMDDFIFLIYCMVIFMVSFKIFIQ